MVPTDARTTPEIIEFASQPTTSSGYPILGAVERWLNNCSWQELLAWFATTSFVLDLAFMTTSHRNVTSVYRAASESLLRGDTPYPPAAESIMGFLYLPGFAVAFSPFALLPPWFGDAIWKTTGLMLLVYAAWSNCRDLDHKLRIRVVLLAFALAAPLVVGNFVNGQANIHLAAACWLATLGAFRRQPVAVLLWTGVAILAKPLAIVMALLIAGLKPRMIPAVAGGIAWAVALPFAVVEPHRTLILYQDFWQIMAPMSLSQGFVATDFTAALSNLGWTLEPSVKTVVRIAAAAASWAIALWLCYQLPRNAAALAVMMIGTTYMCLFNPRAEGITYALLALPIAIAISMHLHEVRSRAWWIMTAAILVMAGSNGLTSKLFHLTEYWFKPTLIAVLLATMAIAVTKTWSNDPLSKRLFDIA